MGSQWTLRYIFLLSLITLTQSVFGNRCPVGYQLFTDGWCRPISNRSLLTCPAGYQLFTDGWCRPKTSSSNLVCPSGYQLFSDGWCHRIVNTQREPNLVPAPSHAHTENHASTQQPKSRTPAGSDSSREVQEKPKEALSKFMVKDFGLPVKDQGHTNQCLQFATTSVFEHFVNKRRACRGITSTKLDWDEYDFLNGQGTSEKFNQFTDQPYIFKANGLAEKYGVSDFERKVLFSRDDAGPRSPWEDGRMSTVELELMKSSMMKYNSPILFVWKHPQRSYWHANLCFGYDDNKVTDWGKGVLICRDSALGELDTEGRRNYYEMPYQMALESGKHATVYYLPEDDPDQKVSRADGAPDCGPEPKKTELASMSKPSHTQSFGDRSSGPFGDSLFKSKRF